MSKLTVPTGYSPKLGLYETQAAIELIKKNFARELTDALNLRRVTAPLFVESGTGLNDNLSGVERAVTFDIPEAGTNAQVVLFNESACTRSGVHPYRHWIWTHFGKA